MSEPPLIYLNHAGTSWPKPPQVAAAISTFCATSVGDWPAKFAAADQRIRKFFKIESDDQLLLTPGCTSSLTTAILDVELVGAQKILISQWEHHAIHRPCLLRSDRHLVEVIPPADAEPLNLNWLEQRFQQGDVGLLAITAASNVTGNLLPYAEAIALARRYGVTSLLDAAQIVGWYDLDFSQIGADLIAFGGHKGLQAPWGIGGLFVARSARLQCTTATCEIPSAAPSQSGREGESRQNPRHIQLAAGSRPDYCDVGSVDQMALAGLVAAMDWLGEDDQADRLQTSLDELEPAWQCLAANPQVDLLTDKSQPYLPTLAFTVRDASQRTIDSSHVALVLRQHGLLVGSGLQCAPLAHEALGTSRTGCLRISAGVGQSAEELHTAAERLRSGLNELTRVPLIS